MNTEFGFQGLDDGIETPEERQRRLAAEAAAAAAGGWWNSGSDLPMGATAGLSGRPPETGLGETLRNGLRGLTGVLERISPPQRQQPITDGGVRGSLDSIPFTAGISDGRESQPVRQTITTDPRTGQQRMRIEGSVEDLSAANPLTPTVAGPAIPDMAAIRRVESGDRDFDAQGRPVRSRAGALYASQVMPATARDPGFGVRPAAAQTPEEYNRVGADYWQAMLQRYNDPAVALAAYNAGPGTVDRNLRANGGRLNIAQLPQETQQYITRVQAQMAQRGGGAAQPQPAAAQPQPQPQPQPTMLGQGIQAPDSTQAGPSFIPTGPADQIDWDNILAAGMTSDAARSQLITAPQTPAMYRRAAIDSEAEALRQQREVQQAEKRAQELLTSGDGRGLTRELRAEGSLLKAVIMGALGARDVARDELEKLGYAPGTWRTVVNADGTSAVVNFRSNGLPTRGYGQDGQLLTEAQLAAVAGEPTRRQLQKGETFVDEEGNAFAQVFDPSRPAGSSMSYQPVGHTNAPQGRLVRSAQSAELAGQQATARTDVQRVSDIIRRGANNVQDAARDYIVQHGPFGSATNPLSESQFAQIFAGQMAVPSAAAPRGRTGTVPAPAAVAPQPPAGAAVAPQPPAGAAVAPTAMPPGAAQGPVPVAPVAPGAAPAAGAPPFVGTRAADAASRTREAQRGIDTASEQRFRTTTQPAAIDAGTQASQVADLRRQQLDVIARNPSILGIYSGAGTQYTRARAIIRDMITGSYDENDSGRLRADVAGLSLSETERAALQDFVTLGLAINPRTLRENTGGGQVSNAEQRLNKETNLANIADLTALSAMQGLNRSLYGNDMIRYRQHLAQSQPDGTSDREFGRIWAEAQQRQSLAYEGIQRARVEFIRNNIQPPPVNASRAQLAAFNDVVMAAFERYPNPSFDAERGTFVYSSPEAERAAARALMRRRGN